MSSSTPPSSATDSIAAQASAPTPTPAPASQVDSPALLSQSEWTRRVIAITSCAVVGLSILAIVATLCYRVWIDGNSSLTNDITTKLAFVAGVSILSMLAAVFGNNSLIAKALDKVIP